MSVRPAVERLDDRVTPAFAALAPFGPTPDNAGFAAAADFNRDGRVDLAVGDTAAAGGDIVRVLLGDGAGGFTLAATVALANQSRARGVVAADVNGDGAPDLVVAGGRTVLGNQVVGTTAVALGNGDGTFTTAFNSDLAAEAVAVADFTGDGRPDLFTLESDNPVPTAPPTPAYRVFTGDGAGGFTPGPRVPLGFGGVRVAVADFNADGRPDVVFRTAADALQVLPNAGGGAFGAPVTLAGTFLDVVAADVTGDGRPDVLAARNPPSALAVFANASAAGGPPAFAAGPDVPTAFFSGGARVAVADFDGDGRPDVVAANAFYNNTSLVYSGAAGGGLTADPGNPYQLPAGVLASDVVTGDVDGDGRTDFIVVGYAGGVGVGRVFLNLAPDSTATTAAAAPNPATAGRPLTLSATVTQPVPQVPLPPPAVTPGPPAGTVTFFLNGAPVGTAPVDATGAASVTITAPLPATYTLTAAYAPAAESPYLASTSAGVAVVVAAAPTATAVTVTPPATTFGQSATLTAAVTQTFTPAATPGPAGAVTFAVDGVAVGTVALDAAGAATLAAPLLAPGPHAVTAAYAGGGAFAGSTSAPANFAVARAPTATALAAGPNPSAVNAAVTLTATVTPAALAGRSPTGTVTFFDGTTALGSAPVDATGAATFATAALAPGGHTLTATYSGDGFFTPSASAPVAQTVNRTTPGVGLLAAPAAVTAGDPATLTAAVGVPPTVPRPTGTVTFLDADTGEAVGIATVGPDGTAAVTVRPTAAGQRRYAAAYSGDANTLPGRSAVVSVQVSVVLLPPPPPPPPVPPLPPPPLPPPPAAVRLLPVAATTDNGPVVCLHTDGGATRKAFQFGAGFENGLRPAVADFTGDGVADVVAGSAPGGPARVALRDGATGQFVADFAPFEASFTGGVFVAAGDVNGDGRPDLAVSADVGGGPRVRVYLNTPAGFILVTDFFAVADPAFRGGARVALGDVDGDGRADLLAAAGAGGGPRVALYSGASLAPGAEPRKLVGDFYASDPALASGAYVALGDVDGDGRADVIAGAGTGGGPRVSVFSGAALARGAVVETATFFAGDPATRGGVRVAARDTDGDGRADVVTGAGAGAGSVVRTYAAVSVTTGAARPLYEFDAFPTLTAGVYVG